MADPTVSLPPVASEEPLPSPEPEVSPQPTPEPSGEPTPQASVPPVITPGPEESFPVLESEPPQVTELVETPPPETPGEPKDLTGLWIGLTVAFAVIAAVLTVLLFRSKKGQKAAPAAVDGPITVGKLHEQGGRKSQQDCFAVSPEELAATHGLLAVVADGMGGLADGDKVSQTAVNAVLEGFWSTAGQPGDILLALVQRANQAVNRLLGPGGQGRSGSTLVAGLIREGRFHYISVGDSRVCLWRDGQLIQLNREHIFRHELSTRAINGKGTLRDAAAHPKAGGLTSYLGMGQLKYVDIPAQPVTILPGDKFILMSDGIYNALTPEEMTAALSGSAAQSAEDLGRLIKAKAYPNQDNYTAVILSC